MTGNEPIPAAITSEPSHDLVVRAPGRAEADPHRFARRRHAVELSLAIGVPTVLILLWQLAAVRGWIDRRLFPAPTDVIAQGRKMFADQGLWSNIWISIQRILWGFFYGATGGIVVGILMGMSRLLRAALEPMLNALYTVPKLAILPIFLIVLGFGEAPVIAVLAVTVFFFVWISTMAAVIDVPAGFRETAKSFSVSPWQMFRHVILPASLPQIFVGLRIAAGVAVLTLIGVEFVFAPSSKGLGFVINQSRQLNVPKQAYAGIVLAAVVGVVFIGLVNLVARVLVPWAPNDKRSGKS